MHDWQLEQENERINEFNRSYYAELAAKLVICGWERSSAVQAIKSVNDYRTMYYGDTNAHVMGDEDQPEIWLLSQCNYPAEVNGSFDPHQIAAIARELIYSFD
ncbi:hypothetical protein [Erwinia rhapontici]|uniref:hypothetical protein n=1 Tax=Erwinia rhapontici TaxID=55212 RepID=UPI0013313500|nr:hypothetical protein [Erwinia rhapontici]MBP2155723.1 hypothetical protein [Erwinia rhapontici]